MSIRLIAIALSILFICSLTEGSSKIVFYTNKMGSPVDSSKGLKDYFAKYFTMGVAVSPRSLQTDEAGLILKNFSSITPENAMKMGPIHPRENEYFWRDSDSIVAFAKNNQIGRAHV